MSMAPYLYHTLLHMCYATCSVTPVMQKWGIHCHASDKPLGVLFLLIDYKTVVGLWCLRHTYLGRVNCCMEATGSMMCYCLCWFSSWHWPWAETACVLVGYVGMLESISARTALQRPCCVHGLTLFVTATCGVPAELCLCVYVPVEL